MVVDFFPDGLAAVDLVAMDFLATGFLAVVDFAAVDLVDFADAFAEVFVAPRDAPLVDVGAAVLAAALVGAIASIRGTGLRGIAART